MTTESTLQSLYEKQHPLLGSLSSLDKSVRSFLKKEPPSPFSIDQLTENLVNPSGDKTPWDFLGFLRELLSLLMIVREEDSLKALQNSLKEVFQKIHPNIFWREFQLPTALIDFTALMLDIPRQLSSIQQLPNGAVPLELGGHWSWGEIPHLRYQAELGVFWALLGVRLQNAEYLLAAERIAEWQLNALDHDFMPFSGLFTQEQDASLTALLSFQYVLFSALAILKQSSRMEYAARKQLEHLKVNVENNQLQIAPLAVLLVGYVEKLGLRPESIQFNLPGKIEDPDTGLIGIRQFKKSIVCTGFGGKTGLGSIHIDGVQLMSYGPQHLPLGDCRGFGVEAGRYSTSKISMGSNISCKDSFQITHQSRLTGKPILSNSELYAHYRNGIYSPAWVDVKQEYKHELLRIDASFLGEIPDEVAFTFFVKAKSCELWGKQTLFPRTLDRYKGDPSTIEFDGGEQLLVLETPHKIGEMQVIPLGGGESFWGADFLVAYLFNFKSNQPYTWQLTTKQQKIFLAQHNGFQ